MLTYQVGYDLLSLPSAFSFRIGKVGNQKRVVGVLLGSWQKKVLDVSNSFAGKRQILHSPSMV